MTAIVLPGSVLTALLAGLAGAPHCVGMCGGLAMAAARRPAEAAAWHAGKLATYAALGAIVGGLGERLPGPGWLPTALAGGLLVVFSAHLAGWLHLPLRAAPGLARLGGALLRRGGLGGRFLFGAVTGLLPCGLVYTALGLALLADSAAGGALAMAAFGLGTLPALALFSAALRRVMQRFPAARPLMAAAVLALGLGALMLRAPAAPDEPPLCHPPAREAR